MNIKKTKNAQDRINIAISQSYRDAHGKSKSRVIKGLGYLDIIEKQHDDPWAFIHQELEKAQAEYDAQHLVSQLPIHLDESLLPDGPPLIFNFGYLAPNFFYHLLEIDYFMNNRRRYTKVSYNHNAIFKMLVFSRLLHPGSKTSAWQQRSQFFDKMDFSLADVYRSLDFFATHAEALQKALDSRIEHIYGRDKSVFYYDVTNYYFEIDHEDTLRKRGPSKEHRKTPIVQMGLFMDAQGLPVSYKLFSGNTHDSSTFSPAVQDLQANHHRSSGRYVVVADNGMFSGDNIRQLLINHNGFILAYSLRGGKQEFQEWTFDSDGYYFLEKSTDRKTGRQILVKKQWDPNHPHADEVSRYKEMITPFTIKLSNVKGKKKDFKLDAVKLVVSYNPAYAAKAREERDRTIKKVKRIIKTKQLFGSQDSRKYIERKEVEKVSGETVETVPLYSLDSEKIAHEEQFDGYHALLTSELDMPTSQVLKQYHGLWEIEETFRISKSELKTRPVFVGTKTHIKAHFLVCFTALTILRLLDKQLGNRFSTAEILKNIREAKAYYLGDNIYRFFHSSNCLNAIGEVTGVDFKKKYMTKKQITQALAATKKID